MLSGTGPFGHHVAAGLCQRRGRGKGGGSAPARRRCRQIGRTNRDSIDSISMARRYSTAMMRDFPLAMFAAVALSTPWVHPVRAQTVDVELTLGVRGTCSHLFLGASDHSKDCLGEVLNSTMTNGRTVFVFSTRDDGMILFAGDGLAQRKPNENTVIQPIDLVRVRYGDETASFDVSGQCTYGNPYVGPAAIECSAQAEDQDYAFAAYFMSDGNDPVPVR
jgi:hypothetical protein